MGIEPFLCIAVFAAGFALQIVIALRDGLKDRLHAGRWMAYLVGAFSRGAGLVRDGGRFRGTLDGYTTTVQVARFTTRSLRRAVYSLTGVWHADTRSLPAGTPNTVLTIALPTRLPHPMTVRAHGSPRRRLETGDPVLDQLLRIQSDADPEPIRAILADESVRDPLLELLGTHPYSVVSDTHVVVWLTGAVRSLHPVVDLATELAEALSAHGQSAHLNARPQEAFAASTMRVTSSSGTA